MGSGGFGGSGVGEGVGVGPDLIVLGVVLRSLSDINFIVLNELNLLGELESYLAQHCLNLFLFENRE